MSRGRYWQLGLALLLVATLYAQRDRIAFELGYAYLHGRFHHLTFARDETKAATWLRVAAEAGHARAQYMLGLNYSRGWGVTQDDAMAEQWFNRAAQQAYGPSCFHLAWMYHKGDGVVRDSTRAQALMACAAEQGVAGAALALAQFLERSEK